MKLVLYILLVAMATLVEAAPAIKSHWDPLDDPSVGLVANDPPTGAYRSDGRLISYYAGISSVVDRNESHPKTEWTCYLPYPHAAGTVLGAPYSRTRVWFLGEIDNRGKDMKTNPIKLRLIGA